jgi:hypothetical protein
MDIKILDNFLSSMYMDHLENLITSATLPLYLNLGTLNGGEFEKGKETPQFTHAFIKNEQIQSKYMTQVEPIIFNFAAKTETLRAKKLTKCKLNLNYKDVSFAEDEFYPIHKDMNEQNGITAIYYVNDCDGDTLFFNSNNEVVKSVTPKKGRIVYFDNQILHAGQPPKKNMYRILINFNWI